VNFKCCRLNEKVYNIIKVKESQSLIKVFLKGIDAQMRLSDYIANYILELLKANENQSVEIKRNELANSIGCVPSQINYVITSRFTPEQGYMVESQRGGGGYIRITRMCYNKESYIMHVINHVGDTLDTATVKAMIHSLAQQQAVEPKVLKTIAAAVSNQAYAVVPQEKRDLLRAAVFKNMLITQL